MSVFAIRGANAQGGRAVPVGLYAGGAAIEVFKVSSRCCHGTILSYRGVAAKQTPPMGFRPSPRAAAFYRLHAACPRLWQWGGFAEVIIRNVELFAGG